MRCFTCEKIWVLLAELPLRLCGYCTRACFCTDGACWNTGLCCVNHAAEVDLTLGRHPWSKYSLSVMFLEPSLPPSRPPPEYKFNETPFPRPTYSAAPVSYSALQRPDSSLAKHQVTKLAYLPYRPPHYSPHQLVFSCEAFAHCERIVVQQNAHPRNDKNFQAPREHASSMKRTVFLPPMRMTTSPVVSQSADLCSFLNRT